MDSDPFRVPVQVAGPGAAVASIFVESGITYLSVVAKVVLQMVHEGFAHPLPPRSISRVDRLAEDSASLELGSETAPFIPGVDVLLTGNARARGKKPIHAVAVRLAVLGSSASYSSSSDGDEEKLELLIDKTVHVYGDRDDEDATTEKFISVPVIYERAPLDEQNPVGRGVAPAPNLMLPEGHQGFASFGPVHPAWPLRQEVLDGASFSEEVDCLVLSEGFPFEYFHLAPLEQRLASGSSIDWVIVEGMHREHRRFATKLPKTRATIEIVDAAGTHDSVDVTCDTVSIDMEEQVISMLFRGHARVTYEELEGLSAVVSLQVATGDSPLIDEPSFVPRAHAAGEISFGGSDASFGGSDASFAGTADGFPETQALVAAEKAALAEPAFDISEDTLPPLDMGDSDDEPPTRLKTSADIDDEPATRLKLSAPAAPPLSGGPGALPEGFAPPGVRLPKHTIPPSQFSPVTAMPFLTKPGAETRPPMGEETREHRDMSALPFTRTGAQPSAQSLFEAPATTQSGRDYDVARDTFTSPAPLLAAGGMANEPTSPPPPNEPEARQQTAPPPAWHDESTPEGQTLGPVAPLPFVKPRESSMMASEPTSADPTAAERALASHLFADAHIARTPTPPAMIPKPPMVSTGEKVPTTIGATFFGSGLGLRPPPAPVAVATNPLLKATAPVEEPPKPAPQVPPSAPPPKKESAAPPPKEVVPPPKEEVKKPPSVPPPMMDESSPRFLVLAKLAKKEAFYNANFANVDLSGIDFSKAVLSGVNFTGANLEDSIFDGARMTQAKLGGARLIQASFTDADLTEADLSKALIEGTNFDRASLTDANFGLVEAKESSFNGATGARITFAQGHFKGASFNSAVFTGADFSGVDVAEATFKEAELTGALFVDARGGATDFENAKLDQASFAGAHLSKSVFKGASLAGSTWERASIEGCVFSGAKMTKANLARTRIDACRFDDADLDTASLVGATGSQTSFAGAKLAGADFRQTKLVDASFESADLRRINAQKAFLTGARFIGADLTGASLRGAKMKGANLEKADVSDSDLRDADLENGDVRVKSNAGAKTGGVILKGATGAGDLVKE